MLWVCALLLGCASSKQATSQAPSQLADPEDFIAESEARIAASPDDPLPYLALGDFYERRGQYGIAVHYYRALLERLPEMVDTEPRFRLGRALLMEGRTNEARKHLLACLTIRPKKVDQYWSNSHYREAHFLLGRLYQQQGDGDRMCHHFREFLRLGGDVERLGPIREQVMHPLED